MDNQLKRNDTNEIITFDQDLRWIDEFTWSAIAQSEPERTLSGSLIIQQGIKQAGRPITLEADNVWLSRATICQLRDWTDVPELQMTYTHYDGRAFRVMFRLHDDPIMAEPVVFSTPEQAQERYTITLKLMQV